MQQVFVWTLSDVIGVTVILLVAFAYLIFIAKQWIGHRMCRHESISETSACDAICRDCGKNLGFIGAWRERKRAV